MATLRDSMIELDPIFGVVGDEEKVSAYVKEELAGMYDEYEADALGNQYFVQNGTNPRVKLMLAAHMDEIGFVVHHIDDKGFIYFIPVGGHDSRVVINQVLAINTSKGLVKGVTGSRPAHIVSAEEQKKGIPIQELHLDAGTSNKAETLELGVRVGDYITFERKGEYLNGGKVFTGKAVDNRAGCAVLIEVMKRLKTKAVAPTVYGVFTVQEEVGLRGAQPAGFRVQPDVALAIDVTLAGGTPGIQDRELPVEFGAGAAIKCYDSGLAVPKKLTNRLVETAEKYAIPYQREVLAKGTTDGHAIALSGSGVLTGCISIPSRYIHSAIGCVHLDDLEHCVQLIVKFIEDFTEKI
ncbi:M42 family metallopeptidase [Paenibacillus humicola]|uniref:M42 family metallopeptidase n=1 Tax=Paenibacillus humicola TaxID=3110540 RepID=UPI00237A9378|nr:M42 family metallopeptidase [Paenibacillus humicola]